MKSTNVNFNDLSRDEQLQLLENASYEDLEQAALSKYPQVQIAVFLHKKTDSKILLKMFESQREPDFLTIFLEDLSDLKHSIVNLLKWENVKTAP